MAEGGYTKAILGSGWRVWGRALLEIGVVAAISLVPLFAGAFREMLIPPTGVEGGPFQRAFLSGQLIFYAVGLTATVAWQSNKDWKDFFPWRSVINLLCFIVIGLCCIAVGADPTLQTLDKGTLATSSVLLFVFAIFMYVLMCLVSEVQPNVGKSLAQSDAALGKGVRKSRGLPDAP